ncbi:hypothetical protein LCGC14_1945760 [marine sediment metagenome]|uniref:Resolvase HTH domain-containing protein n=1 Tax=marine sediment metagenome TaxID=412755 RepID=A0A0F9FIY2_9ZZZZ
MARPTDYDKKHHPPQIYDLTRAGFSISKIARFFKINRDTLYEWKQRHGEFSDNWIRGQDEYYNEGVEKALRKRALGFRFTETTRESRIIIPGDPEKEIEAKYGMIPVKKVSKYYPPDVAAIKHHQVNRDSKRYKDRRTNEITGADGETFAFHMHWPENEPASN